MRIPERFFGLFLANLPPVAGIAPAPLWRLYIGSVSLNFLCLVLASVVIDLPKIVEFSPAVCAEVIGSALALDGIHLATPF